MDIWLVGTSNQLLITGPYTETKFSKNKVDPGKTTFFVIGPFCAPHSIFVLTFVLSVTYGIFQS